LFNAIRVKIIDCCSGVVFFCHNFFQNFHVYLCNQNFINCVKHLSKLWRLIVWSNVHQNFVKILTCICLIKILSKFCQIYVYLINQHFIKTFTCCKQNFIKILSKCWRSLV
jgi:hypothetical protein